MTEGSISPFALALQDLKPLPMKCSVRISALGPTMLPAVQRGISARMFNARLHEGELCVDWDEITAYSPYGSDWQPEE